MKSEHGCDQNWTNALTWGILRHPAKVWLQENALQNPEHYTCLYLVTKSAKRCKDLDLGICLPGIIPDTFLPQAVLEQSLEEATLMINQGNKNHTSSLLRFRDTSFVQPGHFQFGDYWHILLFLQFYVF